ncbi:ferredoxin reductase-like protein [Rhizoclosmatium globosum]|uniref:cytochrome-b5 reductase n=1 Tax=Rhizoclosmatium globosum TaxID=329046 RepID=A0A1Y2CZW6_9FUNG|nr:ferredoxin reductase-like protein [Rhizoclosmatium globosum]|eukprot:ORY52497.1 ferredoxin reductase-like protein [Rhizoclosmatium globosum]
MTIAELQQKYKTNPTPALTDNSVFVPFKLLETQVIRPYTPIEDPNLGYTGKFELIVKHYVGGPCHTHLQLEGWRLFGHEGTILKYQYVANRDRHIGLIAGGTGLGDDKDDTKFTLLFANVTEQDIFSIHLHYLLDNPPANWTGRTGRVTKEVIQETLPKPGEGKVFVCGPLPMVASLSGLKNKDFTQGELSGALAELGYVKEEVFKF